MKNDISGMENIEMANKEKEFDLLALLEVLRRFWILILAITLVFGAVGVTYSVLTDTTTYTGTASFWVNSTSSSSMGNVNQSNTMGAAQMASNYIELAKKDFLVRRAVQNGDLAVKWNTTEDGAVNRLKNMIYATKSDPDSLVFSVYVVSNNANIAFEATQAIQSTMEEVIVEVNGETIGSANGKYITIIDQVQTLDDITVSSPSILKKGVIFAMIGFVLAYCLFFAISFFSTKVYEVKRLAERYDLPILAEVPMRKPTTADNEVDDNPFAFDAFTVLRNAISSEDDKVVTILPTSTECSGNYISMGVAYAFSRLGKKTLYVTNLYTKNEETQDSGTLNIISSEGLVTYAEPPKSAWVDSRIDGMALASLIEGARESYDVIVVDLPDRERVYDISAYSALSKKAVLVVHKNDDYKEIDATIKVLVGGGVEAGGFCFVE